MDAAAVYNIGVVARMTDIAENTLRIWERRYGFPTPDRTEGGHRLYSAREVARIQWVKQRLDEGMQIRNAIQALSQHEETGLSVNASLESQAVARSSVSSATTRKQLLEALIALDKHQADLILGDALAIHSLEQLLLTIIAPTFTAIGQAWQTDRISIATEHFATNYLRHKLLTWMQMAPPEYPVQPVVLACAPGELHEGGLLMLGLLLQRLRWPVVYLGQSIDLPDLIVLVEQIKPSMIVFVAMTEPSAQALSQWPTMASKGQGQENPNCGLCRLHFHAGSDLDRTRVRRVPRRYDIGGIGHSQRIAAPTEPLSRLDRTAHPPLDRPPCNELTWPGSCPRCPCRSPGWRDQPDQRAVLGVADLADVVQHNER